MASEVLKLDQSGTVIFETIDQRLQFADTLLRSGMLPKSYQNKEQVAAALQLAAELGLKPGIKSLSRTANINGTPNLFGEAPLAICQASGKLQDWSGYYFDEKFLEISVENKNVGSPIFGYHFTCLRAGKTKWHKEFYTLAMAKKAGLGNVWNKHPEDMLRWRTVGKSLKLEFADVLVGAQIAEYDNNTAVDFGAIKIDSGNNNTESDLNERFRTTLEPAKPGVDIMTITENKNVPRVEKEIAAFLKDDTVTQKMVSLSEEGEAEASAAEDVESFLLDAFKKKEVAPKAFNPKSTDHDDLSKYVIPMGNYKGKTLKTVALAELVSMVPKLQGYIAKRPIDAEIAQDLLNSISLWIEKQDGF